MKTPLEIFGYPENNTSKEAKKARKTYTCPFIESQCTKQSRTIKYPMGVCSVNFNEQKIAICPNRFLETQTVFRDISQALWGNSDNVLLLSEVKIAGVGAFDFVLVKHEALSTKVEDFCIVEFQTDSTTSTGKLVEALKDFMENKTMQETYAFGIH